MRSVGRVVTRASFGGGPLQEPTISSSTASTANTTSSSTTPRHVQKSGNSSTNNLSLSWPFASCNVNNNNNNNHVYGLPPTSSPPSPSSWPHCDEPDWVAVDGGCEEEEKAFHGFVDEFVLGPVPSEDEVHCAVSALQQVFNHESCCNLVRDKFVPELDKGEEHQVIIPTDFVHQISSAGSEGDWMEPSICMCNSKMLQRYGSERVYDAFHLLRTEPLVQKMVKSLSSDEAVWNAVLNNEAVRELRDSFYSEDNRPESPDERPEDSNEETNIVKWIFDGTRSKIMEVVEKITKFMNDLFQPPENEKTTSDSGSTDLFKEKLRTSFMLSIMVLLVVVLARANKA